VADGKYPFMAVLEIRFRDGSSPSCAGTLIDPDSVLTAAHCVDRFGPGSIWNKTPQDLSNMRVLVGRTQLTPSFKPPLGRTNGQIRGVSDIAISNNWNNPKSPSSLNDYTWDVAVLKLSSPVTGITPVRIPFEAANSYQEPGKSLMTVAG
jgi:hypothetical protein